VTSLLRAATIGIAVLLSSWALLMILSRTLPPGPTRDLARFLPDCATTMRRLRKHPSVPRRTRFLVVFALLWVISPIDLIPEFIPIIGPLDDVIVVALVLRAAAKKIPSDVLFEAWPGNPAILKRLIGLEAAP
jgi:uncharacterized membrane protein YkvA (DUF1232 family)